MPRRTKTMSRQMLVRLDSLFEISSGHQLSKGRLSPCEPGEGFAYVSRTHRNNGVNALAVDRSVSRWGWVRWCW